MNDNNIFSIETRCRYAAHAIYFHYLSNAVISSIRLIMDMDKWNLHNNCIGLSALSTSFHSVHLKTCFFLWMCAWSSLQLIFQLINPIYVDIFTHTHTHIHHTPVCGESILPRHHKKYISRLKRMHKHDKQIANYRNRMRKSHSIFPKIFHKSISAWWANKIILITGTDE